MKKTFSLLKIWISIILYVTVLFQGESRSNRFYWADGLFDSFSSYKTSSSCSGDFESLDIAPFAKVYTWNPEILSHYPGRVQELNVDDIFHGKEILAASDGNYFVPVTKKREKCIGLQWYENRELDRLAVEFAENSYMPDVKKSRVEFWVGESEWQGFWIKLTSDIEVSGRRWLISVTENDLSIAKDQIAAKIGKGRLMPFYLNPQKIRWVFPASDHDIILSDINAFTHLKYNNLGLLLENEDKKGNGLISIYNGQIIKSQEGESGLETNWNLKEPLILNIKYCITKEVPPTNRTILNVQLPEGQFGVSVVDIIENGGIYVPDYGFYITLADKPLSLKDYKDNIISGKKTVLEKVRQMPDQSFERAMRNVHRSIQDKGPVMLSLACDNKKFIVERDGRTWFSDKIGGRKE